jgi:hypothetical protein
VQEPETTADEAPTPAEPTAEAERPREDLFEYSRWIHIGDGALDCPDARTGKCRASEHFHAWIRLPNPLQIRDIAEKAKAAQARRRRMLKDQQTDAWVILEDSMDELRDESMRGLMVEDLLGENFHEVYQDAVREVLDREEEDAKADEETGEVPKLYAHIEQDREEYDRLAQLPEEQRDADEFNSLERRIGNYSRDLEAEIKRLQEPRRASLEEKSTDELIDMIRQKRIASEGADAYINTFNTWQMYVCTFQPREKGVPRERYFADINSLKHDQPSSVVQALQQNFRDLEIKLARNRGLGNS